MGAAVSNLPRARASSYAMLRKRHESHESGTESQRPAQFFVETTTPKDGNNDHDGGRARRTVTVRSREDSIPIADFDTTQRGHPQVHVEVQSKKLLYFVATTTVFIGVFTGVFYHGIVVETVYEAIGSSKKSEDAVEKYNTISGYVMALIEVLVGMHIEKFHPVLDVYVHNALYFLMRGSPESTPGKLRARRALHTTVMFAFPLLLTLLMGNSLRGLQAAQSSVGFRHIMRAEDLKKEQPVMELIKDAAKKRNKNNSSNAALAAGFKGLALGETVLKNAVLGRSTPFTFATKSVCKSDDDADGNKKKNTTTPTSGSKASRQVQLNVHDLDSTSVVYGFEPQEWNGEAIDSEIRASYIYNVTFDQVLGKSANTSKAKPPSNFSLTTAFEIFMQGKILVEKAYADSTRDMYPCVLTDGRGYLDGIVHPEEISNSSNSTSHPNNGTSHRRRRRLQDASSGSLDDDDDGWIEYDPEEDNGQWFFNQTDGKRYCEGAISSVFDFVPYQDPSTHTLENFMTVVTEAINTTFESFALDETTVFFEKYDVTPQIEVEALRIDMKIDANVNYGLKVTCADEGEDSDCNHMYSYKGMSESFCGSAGCAFVDHSKTFKLQKEIGMIPYMTNCSFDDKHVKYSSDFRGFYPTQCTKSENSVLIYGIGSYIKGREYGAVDDKFGSKTPYIIRARRHVTFSFAKMTWKTEDIAHRFGATCKNGKQNTDCTGLWYKLEPSGRFLFAGKDALPTKALSHADFRTPLPLVQINTPTLYVSTFEDVATLERLNPKNFDVVKWNSTKNQTLHGASCSMLVESYLNHIADNNFFLERPMQSLYTSAFFYLMEKAAVTAINDTKLATNASMNATQRVIQLGKQKDLLGNVKLNGDAQIRDIRVLIPMGSFLTTLGGCIFIFIFLVIVLVFPARRVEHFAEGTTKAQEYVAMAKDEVYPDAVHSKTVMFPGSGEVVPTEDLVVENATLVHEQDRNRVLRL